MRARAVVAAHARFHGLGTRSRCRMRASASSMRRASPGWWWSWPGEMQRAMHHQMRQMVRRAAPGGGGLAADDAERQQHFRRRGGVGQHVGRLVASAMPRIQPPHRAVGCQHNGAAGTRRPRGARRHGFGMRNQPSPRRLGYNDVNLRPGTPLARGRLLASGSIAYLPVPSVSPRRRASRRLSPSAAAR